MAENPPSVPLPNLPGEGEATPEEDQAREFLVERREKAHLEALQITTDALEEFAVTAKRASLGISGLIFCSSLDKLVRETTLFLMPSP